MTSIHHSNSILRNVLLAFGLAPLASLPLQAQHGHLNAGAAGTAQNVPLIWANGDEFAVSSGYVKTLDFTNAGRYAGFFQQNITLTALPATAANAGPDPQASALGSFLQARMACLEAPPGGEFGFWETGASTPTISLPAGGVAPALFSLSQYDGAPGSDPFGHIHGRRFTATKPGFYTVAFQALDTSTNGAGGGPIHSPSAPLAIRFQAGVHLMTVEPDYDEGRVHLRLAPPANTAWQIESADSPAPDATWIAVGAPVAGTDLVVEKMLEGDPGSSRFYRLRRLMP